MTAQAEAPHAALAAAAALRVRNSAARCLCGVLNSVRAPCDLIVAPALMPQFSLV
jgi:hypothetical protein